MEYRSKLRELGIFLEKSGRQTCPKCSASRKNSKEKCLTVTYDTDAVLYNCHHCGWGGSVFYRHRETHRKIYRKPEQPVKVENSSPLVRYFAKRKISEETLKKYDISLNANKEIQIPYYKDGELVNIKYRTNLGGGKKTFRQEKDTEKTFYGMDLVDKNNPLIIVEGEMDVLALAEVNIYAVSVPQGGSDTKLECIENCWGWFKEFKEFVIAVDNDEVGNKLKNTLIDRLGKENCKVVNWGKYKDANEALMAGEDVASYIVNATQLNPDGLNLYYDNFDSIYKHVYELDNDYYSTGWRTLDEYLKVRTGYLMVVSGYPSRGKSTFVDNLLINLSKGYGLKHLIASFETTNEDSYVALLEMLKQQPIKKIKENNEVFGDDFNFIAEHFYRLSVERLWSIDQIINITEFMVKRYGVKTLVIDPYNRLNNDYTDREDKYIGSILAKLCMLSKKLNILVIFVAHPKKPDGEKVPTMYSISGSGDWYNMADYGIIVHRERDENTKELKNEPTITIAKVKNFKLGKPSGGEITLRYNVEKRILED